MAEAGVIHIEIVYALPDEQVLRTLQVPQGATIADALKLSGLDVAQNAGASINVGIYGKRKTPATVLMEGDRVEIYRPLQADPKEARRKRVKR